MNNNADVKDIGKTLSARKNGSRKRRERNLDRWLNKKIDLSLPKYDYSENVNTNLCLPFPIWTQIFSYTKSVNIVRLTQTCKYLQILVQHYLILTWSKYNKNVLSVKARICAELSNISYISRTLNRLIQSIKV